MIDTNLVIIINYKLLIWKINIDLKRKKKEKWNYVLITYRDTFFLYLYIIIISSILVDSFQCSIIHKYKIIIFVHSSHLHLFFSLHARRDWSKTLCVFILRHMLQIFKYFITVTWTLVNTTFNLEPLSNFCFSQIFHLNFHFSLLFSSTCWKKYSFLSSYYIFSHLFSSSIFKSMFIIYYVYRGSLK